MLDISQYKTVLQSVYVAFDAAEKVINVSQVLGGVKLRDMFKLEFGHYLMYLASSDGKITARERDFMNLLMETNMEIPAYVKYIEENEIYSVKFEEQIPVTLFFAVMADVKMRRTQQGGDDEMKTFCLLLLDCYVKLGEALIACDGEVHPQEEADMKIYVTMLSKAIQEFTMAAIEADEEEVGYVSGKKGKYPWDD